MKLTQYPRNWDSTPMDLLVGVVTDASGNDGAKLSPVPQGPDGTPIDAVALILVDKYGDVILPGGGGGGSADNTPFGPEWDGSLNAPTQNAVYDVVAKKLTVDESVYPGERSVVWGAVGTTRQLFVAIGNPGENIYTKSAAGLVTGYAGSPGYVEFNGKKLDGTTDMRGWVGYRTANDRFEIGGMGGVAYEFQVTPYVGTKRILTEDDLGGGGGGSYTDEQAQDAVGNIFNTDGDVQIDYDDTTPEILIQTLPDKVINLGSGTTTWTLASTIRNTINYLFGSGSAVTVTAPAEGSDPIPNGKVFILTQRGAGVVTLQAEAGATIETPGGGASVSTTGPNTAIWVQKVGNSPAVYSAYVRQLPGSGGGGSISDVAYGPSWDGVTTTAPSKNAVYDKIESLPLPGSVISDAAFAAGWDGVTGIAPSKNAVYDKLIVMDGIISGKADTSAMNALVNDTPYAGSWDGDTTHAPSKNAVYDKIASLPAPSSVISDAAYGGAWDGDGVNAPSKNAVYDKLAANDAIIGALVNDTAYGGSWDGDTTHAPSKNAVYDKIETLAAGGGGAPNVQSVVSAATVTPTFANDQVNITALAVSCQLLNPTGTPVDAHGLVVRIKDNGGIRGLTYDTQYRAIGASLPITTAAGKTMYLGFIWNAADTKFDLLSVALEA